MNLVLQLIFDVILLRRIERNYADRAVSFLRIFKPCHDFFHKRVAFFFVAFAAAPFVNAVDIGKFYFAFQLVRRRESEQLIVVKHAVGKRDKAFVIAAVMPRKMTFGHADCKAVVKNAFKVFDFEVLFVAIIGAEEHRGRKLLRIADDDDVFTARDRAYRLARGHLRRLVKDHKVEFFLFDIEILCNRHRTHQKTRASRTKYFGNLRKQRAYRRALHIRFFGAVQQNSFQVMFARSIGSRKFRHEP